MSREQVSTEFDCRRISVIVHRSASDKLAVVHLPCLFAAESYTVKERERVLLLTVTDVSTTSAVVIFRVKVR